MELFNIGIPELLLILMVMLVVLGPTEMSATVRKFARWMRRVSQTETWRLMRDTTEELRELPSQLMREAGLEEWQQQIAPSPNAPLKSSAVKPPPPPSAPLPPGVVNPASPEPENLLPDGDTASHDDSRPEAS